MVYSTSSILDAELKVRTLHIITIIIIIIIIITSETAEQYYNY